LRSYQSGGWDGSFRVIYYYGITMKKLNKNIQTLHPRVIGAEIKKKLPAGLRKDIHDFSQPDIFIITRIEESAPYIEFPIKLHRRDQFEFLLITEGHAIRTKGLNSYRLNKNSLFFLPPGQITSTEFVSEDCKGYFCMFDAAFFYSFSRENNYLDRFSFFQTEGDPLIALPQESMRDILFLLNKLYNEFMEATVNKQDIAATLIRAVLLEADKYQTIPKEGPPITPAIPVELVRKYKYLLNKYLLSKKSLKEYADLLFVSPNHLNKCVKEVTGKTAGMLIVDMQLLEAKVLLKQTDLTVSQIAGRLGFYDSSYFSRFFKKNAGVTPFTYRKTS